MTMRPQNECKRCGYTWYPRGKNRSNKCPDCGSRAVQISPISLAGVGVAGVAIMLLCCCSGVGGLFGDKSKNNIEQPIAKNATQSEKTEKEAQPKRKSTEPTTPPTPDDKKKFIEKKAALPAPETEPSVIGEAPFPRPVVPLNRIPVGFTSPWVHRSGVQTRLVGANICQPILIDAAGKEFISPDPLLVLWVETRSLTANNVALRPWISPGSEYASIREDKTGMAVKAKKFPNGVRVGGRIDGAVKLTPDGPSVVEVLAFDCPANEHDLRLTLQASNFGQREAFSHTIPYAVWSQK